MQMSLAQGLFELHGAFFLSLYLPISLSSPLSPSHSLHFLSVFEPYFLLLIGTQGKNLGVSGKKTSSKAEFSTRSPTNNGLFAQLKSSTHKSLSLRFVRNKGLYSLHGILLLG